MKTLQLKVVRDALHARGQLIAVLVLVASGVATFVMLRSMHGFLRGGQERYYRDARFGDVFSHVVRAPDALAPRIARIDGVATVYTRLVEDILLDVPGLPEPATGRLVSLPDLGEVRLNQVVIRTGALPDPGRRDQVVLSEAFARANGLRVGDVVGAILNGRLQALRVVGTAISPEFIYEIGEYGQVFPDNRRFGALWMSRSAVESAFEMEGAFNDIVLSLAPGASEAAVLASLDALLDPYGNPGAYGRELHVSHEFLEGEIDETTITASFFPALFLIVTAFLLHATLLRIVRMEREQIGLLKAFGISPASLGAHYLQFALIPVAGGAVLGTVVGVWLAHGMAEVYARFFQFPEVGFKLDLTVVLVAWAIALITGVLGALTAVRTVTRLPPAVAMAPPAPPRYREGPLERTRIWRALSPAGRIVVRNLSRARLKSASTIAGIGLALGVIGALLSMFDAINEIARIQFQEVQREDVSVYFHRPRPPDVRAALFALPGVRQVETFRVVPVRFVREHREVRGSILGLPEDAQLRRLVDSESRTHQLPVGGLLLSTLLAEKLGVHPGDVVEIHVTEGSDVTRELRVSGIIDELMGGGGYMAKADLHRALGEASSESGAWLAVDARTRAEVYERLKHLPAVAGIQVRELTVRGFADTIEESFAIALYSTVVLGMALVMAIVYNQTRIALSERGRELASLRVLGFERGEVARMLLSEQALLVLAALPLGVGLGWFLTFLVMERFDSDLFSLPVVVARGTYAQAIGIVLLAAVLSGLLVRRRLNRIDLIAVLKTRE
ncbi:MAG: ABC transporter permease [Gemmatimonadota bacterium]